MGSAHSNIVILTGAGISAESGLDTFRGAGGLWAGHRVEDVATPEAFARDPTLVHAFYNARRRQLLEPSVQPNPAHMALARLDTAWSGELLLVTQNVDDLHERAGSERLIHMHGELLRARCGYCGEGRIWQDELTVETSCPGCRRSRGMRPDIVWFGEMPLALDTIFQALERCDLFVAIGTSGQVYPAAGFVEAAASARSIEINLEPSAVGSCFHEHRAGPAGTTVPQLVEELLQG